MKKTLALLSISVVIFTANAQDSKIILGLEAGATRSNLWGNDVPDEVNPIYGISPGINLEYILTPVLSIKTGLYYERKGFTSELNVTDINGTPVVTRDQSAYFDYLLTPVLISLSTKGVVKFYATGGAFVGFLLSNTTVFSASGDYPEETFDVSEDTRKTDFGLSFGCGIMRPIGSRIVLDFGLRDNLSLIDNFKPENEGKSHLNALGLFLSLKYRL